MNKSDSIAAISKALAGAQAEMENPGFDSMNPHFKSKFASLAAVREVVLPVLNKHGLALSQWPTASEGAAGCTNLLSHTSGEWIESVCLFPLDKNNAQGAASCVTYARRISMQSIAAVVGEEDDDGNAASKTKETTGKGVIKPSDGVEDRIATERKGALNTILGSVVDCINEGLPTDAIHCLEAITDPDEKVYVWDQLDSKQRSLIKRTKQEMALKKGT